jgi:hypothetical protein
MNKTLNIIPDYDVLNSIPEDIEYYLDCKINQSIAMADEYLKKNRPVELVNNVIKINNQNIDLYDYLIINDNFINGEYALVAYSDDNNMWFVRKTYDGLIQYYNFTYDDSFQTNDLFDYFIRGYKEKIVF